MRIFAGLLLGSGVKRQWGCRQRQFFLAILGGYIFGNFRNKANNYMTICYPLSACKWLQNEWHRMTGCVYFMSKSVFMPAVWDSERWSFKDNCAKISSLSIDPSYLRKKWRSMILVSGNINLVDIRHLWPSRNISRLIYLVYLYRAQCKEPL